MANMAIPKGEIIVDSRGRTSLARVCDKLYGRYLVETFPDGKIVLTPAVIVAVRDLDKFLDNPEASGTRRERPGRA
jgi:hypothetical protein